MAFNIGSLLSKRANISPRKEAFVEFERDRKFDFAQLNLRCNKAANSLLEAGVKPGDRENPRWQHRRQGPHGFQES